LEKIRTAVTATIVDKYLRELEKFCDIKMGGWIATGAFMPEDELISFIEGAQILIVEYEEITQRIIESSDTLRLIICPRGTPVNIDCGAATARGIPVIFTPGRNANSVAEYIVSSMISVSRHLGQAYHEIKNGRYLHEPVADLYKPSDQDDVVWSIDEEDNPFKTYKGYEITGRVMGFIGLGAVGIRTVELLAGMDMRFLAYDPYCTSELAAKYHVELLPLDDVLEQSDFISVCCKVTPETVGMIGIRQFNKMRKSAYFINTARGSIVRQQDLVAALEEEKIAGAVIDVFWREPLPANHPLLKMPNVLVTPHIAGSSYDVPSCHSRMILEEVVNYTRGKPPIRVYNRSGLEAK
jgi:D-3-phosphoglycerate dehydrogenase